MYKKRIAVPAAYGSDQGPKKEPSVQTEQSLYQDLSSQLQTLINKLPAGCVYKAQAQVVLDTARMAKNDCNWRYPNTMLSVLETLRQTIDLLTFIQQGVQPSVSNLGSTHKATDGLDEYEFDSDEESESESAVLIPAPLLTQLQQYEAFGRSLKWKAGCQILGGAVCALVGVILFVAFISFYFIFPYLTPLWKSATPFVVNLLVFGSVFANVLSAFSAAGGVILISTGVLNARLANSVSGLLTKVREHVNTRLTQPTNSLVTSKDPFARGLELLNQPGKVSEALVCFKQVPETDPNHANAQRLIQIYTVNDPMAPGSPSKKNVLLSDPSYREREAKRRLAFSAEHNTDEPVEAVEDDWRVVRKRLGANSAEYARYLLEQTSNRQAVEPELVVSTPVF